MDNLVPAVVVSSVPNIAFIYKTPELQVGMKFVWSLTYQHFGRLAVLNKNREISQS